MGVLNNFLIKLGLKPKMIESGDKKAETVIKAEAEQFNQSLNVDPSTIIHSQPSQEGNLLANSERRQEPHKPTVKVFAEKNIHSRRVEYVVTLETDTDVLVPITIMREKPEEVRLKDFVGEVEAAIVELQNANNPIEFRQNRAREILESINRRYKVDFTEKMYSIIDGVSAGNGVSYQHIEGALPKKIDVGALSRRELIQYGKMLTERLQVLDSIKSPEDAYRARISLESFMKSQERATGEGAIVAANLENLENGENALDIQTVIACAKKLETFCNEDGLLYSTYLKLEENRIIRKLQQDILAYRQEIEGMPEMASVVETADELQKYLEDSKINTDSEHSDDIVGYMVDTIRGEGIEKYIESFSKHDMKLKTFLQENPVPNKEKALNYVFAKLACFGQVAPTPETPGGEGKLQQLRSFIEGTDYKDDDFTESKKFLHTMVQIERDYIEKNYSPVLKEFQKIVAEKTK